MIQSKVSVIVYQASSVISNVITQMQHQLNRSIQLVCKTWCCFESRGFSVICDIERGDVTDSAYKCLNLIA